MMHPPPSRYEPMVEDDEDDDDDNFSILSGSFTNFSATHASSATSIEMLSVRSESPAPSVMSMSSSLRASAYRHEYGRGLNNYSEVYRLPADDEELDRLGAPCIPHISVPFSDIAP